MTITTNHHDSMQVMPSVALCPDSRVEAKGEGDDCAVLLNPLLG